jgi:hypothetical protein
VKDFLNIYQCNFEITLRDRKVHELAKRYHEECEAYDREHCSGPIIRGGIVPMTPDERKAIGRYAREKRASNYNARQMNMASAPRN